MAEFDYDAFFNDHYDYFVQAQLPPERTHAEADLIARLAPAASSGAVLDIGCGTGRIALELARRGARVTGFDTNTRYIEHARAQAQADGLAATFTVADMRELGPAAGQFDLILLWSNTFGYFGDATNRAQLAAACKLLRPGGVLLLDQHNRDWIIRHWQDTLVVRQGDDYFMDENVFDLLTGRTLNQRTYVRDGRVVGHARFNSRLFCPPELASWLQDAGFATVTFCGEDGELLTLKHRRQVVMAGRPS
ncbi:MAG: methyltransferase domain-containing protein [Dactylosporangium sp.]|nr:methyltransferase domain-containing protein [Dactylosporangium sp.]NNJ62499.1 methyltransferase domain-containing protein [Dactylosporangium sp.]